MKKALIEMITSVQDEKVLIAVMDLLQDPTEERLSAYIKALNL